MRTFILAALALAALCGSASAQQPQHITPSQMALQIDNAIGQLATTLEQSQEQVKALQEQIKSLQAKPDTKSENVEPKK